MQLGREQLLVWQLGLIFGDERGRKRAAEGVLDHLAVLAGAEKDADGRSFVRLADVTVESLQVEFQLAEVLGLELTDLELDGDQAAQAAMEEQQVEREISSADLKWHLAADETEVAADLGKKWRRFRTRLACRSAS